MRCRPRLRALGLLLAVGACSGGPSAREIGPPTNAELAERFYASAGDELLRYAPAGADLVIELDLARIRDNETLGPLYGAAGNLSADVAPQFHPMRDADALVLCSYDLGEVTAKTITLVHSPRLAELAGKAAVADQVVVVGDRAARERVSQVGRGEDPALADDLAFRSLRDRAVPDGAPGAALRVTASLDFDARVSLSSRLDLDHVPTSVSAWGDVVDDLAIVALMGADSQVDARRLAAASRRALSQLAGHPLATKLVVGYLFETVEVKEVKNGAMLVFHVSPRRLSLLVERLTRRALELGPSAPTAADNPVGS